MAFEMMSIPQNENKFRFEIAPAHNALTSLWLLNFEELNNKDWIQRTRKKLTAEQLLRNKEVCWPGATFLSNKTWQSFPAWLEDLSKRNPVELGQYDLSNLLERISVYTDEFSEVTMEELYADPALYVQVIKTINEYTNWKFNQEEVEAEHHILTHPEQMAERKEKILTHLTMMWEEHLSTEWERNLSLVEDSVAAYNAIETRGLSDAEALARITDGGKVPKPWQNWLPFAKRVICFPNPHIFFHSLVIDRTLRSVYTALPVFVPTETIVHPSALSRSMLKTSLSALADDTRMRIIELLVKEPGLNTKDIQEKLNMSQSAVSRHVNQLASSGFVKVIRVSGVNMYAVCPDIVHDLYQSLKELFGKE